MYKTADDKAKIEYWDNQGYITVSKLRDILTNLCHDGYEDHYILMNALDCPATSFEIFKYEGIETFEQTFITTREAKAFEENGWKALRLHF